MHHLRDLFFTYAPWVILWPLILAARLYRRKIPTVQVLSWYLLVAFITQAVSFTFWKLRKNNYPILHIYTVAEFLLLLWFFYGLLKHVIPRAVFIILAIAFPLFSIINSLFIETVYQLNGYALSVKAFIFICFSVCWFVNAITTAESRPSSNAARHLVTAGLLIYFAGSLALFSLGTYIENLTRPFRLNAWSLHTLLAVTLYLLIAAGLWKQKKA